MSLLLSRSRRMHACGGIAVVAVLTACGDKTNNIITPPVDTTSQAPATVVCDADNGGITLPAGFCAVVVADLKSAGQPALARHMAVTPNGDVFVAINNPRTTNPPFGIIGLRDADQNGRAEQQSQFSANLGGSGIDWNNGVLYFGANDRIMRYQLPSGQLEPTSTAQTIVSGLPSVAGPLPQNAVHRPVGVTEGPDGSLYISDDKGGRIWRVIHR